MDADGKGERKPLEARARILDTADRLFYGEGIRAVDVGRVLDESRVTRATFDRLFGSKDDLIVAYLAARSVRDRARVEAAWAATPDDPRAVLRAIVADVVAQSREPVFRGSPYLNAAAEYSDTDHPVRRFVAEHRTWFRLIMVELLTELGRPNADAAADQMVLLHDGGMVGAYLGDLNTLATALTEAGDAVIDHR